MASISTAESGTKKSPIVGRKKVGKESAGRRRNGAISADVSKSAENRSAGTAANDGIALPRLEFEMALEIVVPNEENWKTIVRDAAEAAGGDLLFILPYAENPNGEDGGLPAGTAPPDHAMVRLVEGRESRLYLVRAGEAGFYMVEEDAIEAGLVRFARASIDVLERLGADKRIVAPLITLAKH